MITQLGDVHHELVQGMQLSEVVSNGIVAVYTRGGANPDIVGAILEDGIDIVCIEALRIVFIGIVVPDGFCLQIHHV